MLQLSHVSKRYGVDGGLFTKRELTAVDDISLDIRRGEFFSLVGESGCGKSTLARIICGLDTPSAGDLTIDGVRIGPTAFKDRTLRRKVQMVFQDPYSSLNPRMRVRDILAEPLRSFGWPGGQAGIEQRIAELASIIGFPEDALQRYPHQFSGGQRQRIAIARALAANPDILVCDEPVSALDVSIKGQIINLLLDVQERLGLTILFISHDLSLVAKISDRVGVMYLGSMVEVAPADELFTDPRHPYTRLLIQSIPSTDPALRRRNPLPAGEMPSPYAIPSGCRFRDRCPAVLPRCSTEPPRLAPCGTGAEHVAACHLRSQAAERIRTDSRRTIEGIELFRT